MSEQATSCMAFIASMRQKFKLLLSLDDGSECKKKGSSLIDDEERTTIVNLALMGTKLHDIQKRTGRRQQAILMTLAIEGVDVRPLYKNKPNCAHSMALGKECHTYLAKRNNLLQFSKDRKVTLASAAVSLGMYRSTL
jgi:hypothetical protein